MWQSSHRTQEAVTHKRPRKPFVPEIKTASTKDHTFSEVRIAWKSRENYKDYAHSLPPFPFQVYVLNSARKSIQDPDFPASFVDWFEDRLSSEQDEPTLHAHFEFYSNGFNNVLDCAAHQRREIESRNRNAIWPRLVRFWGPYESFILVIDRDHWMSNGFIMVDFNEKAREVPDPSGLFRGGDDTVLWAERTTGIVDLIHAWRHSGHKWAQLDLENHNRGGFSPALYPAVDPSAHHDAEDDHQIEDVSVLNPGADGSSSISDTEAEGASHEKSPHHDVIMNDLMRSSHDIEDLRTYTYEGLAGWETTSVWRSSVSKTRPPFSFVLYLSSDLVPFESKALFACLGRELLSTAAWTLDIVRNVPNIQSALRHHSHEKSRRTPSKTARRLKCSRMLLDKICGRVLPEELIQLIEDILVPPVCSTYSAAPYRVFHDVFLFLDASTQLTGPKMVYHNHVWDYPAIGAEHAAHDEPYVGKRLQRDPDSVHRGGPIVKTHVTDLRSWRLVSDELHTLWSLCSPREKISPSSLPWFSVRLFFPTKYRLPSMGLFPDVNQDLNIAKAVLTLHSSEPVTIHDPWTLSSQIWHDGIEITDIKNNTKLPETTTPLNNIIDQRTASWSEDPKMREQDLEPDEAGAMLTTISPGGKLKLDIMPDDQWWQSQSDNELLEMDYEYSIRIKEDFCVTRWTYGSLPGLKGPYNLPPIPVRGKNVCRFKFTIPSLRDRDNFEFVHWNDTSEDEDMEDENYFDYDEDDDEDDDNMDASVNDTRGDMETAENEGDAMLQ